jgi:integrase
VAGPASRPGAAECGRRDVAGVAAHCETSDVGKRPRGVAEPPAGGPLLEMNWQRSVSWREAKAAIGRPELRVHDLRHTAASVWLASGADPKVVQRVLGHATAAMTMDLYGHMIERNLWDTAQRLGAPRGHRRTMKMTPSRKVIAD